MGFKQNKQQMLIRMRSVRISKVKWRKNEQYEFVNYHRNSFVLGFAAGLVFPFLDVNNSFQRVLTDR